MKRKIHWDKMAIVSFSKAVSYIREESPKNADQVKQGVLFRIAGLSTMPEIYSIDKYKVDNDGSYQCFEVYHLRVSYLIKEEVIIIIMIRHTSQEPLLY